MITHEIGAPARPPHPPCGACLSQRFDLGAVCLNRLCQQHLPHPSNNKSRPVILLRTLCRLQRSQVLCNQANPHSLAKTPGWGEGSSSRYRSTNAKRHASKSFRINTCKSESKQRTLTTFRMNTYVKQGEGGVLLLTRIPKDFCPERPRGAQGSLPPKSRGNSRPLGSPHRLRAIRRPHQLGAIAGIDADVLGREVAGPVARAGRAGVQVHHDGHMVR